MLQVTYIPCLLLRQRQLLENSEFAILLMGCLHENFFIDFPSDSCCTHKISEHVCSGFTTCHKNHWLKVLVSHHAVDQYIIEK
jgi:hypothetical protein